MEAYYPYFWLAVIIFAAVLEAMTAQMVSIWMVVGGIAALIASVCNTSFTVQLVVFVVVTVITLAVTRPFIKKILHFKKEDTNAGRYLGKTGVVLAEINNTLGKGEVKVLGNIWTARSADGCVIPEGAQVLVDRIEGVKLIVKLKNHEN